ncbi:heat shock 70 kDa protein 12A-like [Ylistrum balloti]|uniref:heat shock 70 kDa protein 12A-like n=1 Tax=Ylistrum balloti TaxID=509963 RepID=UPI002905D29F|nr:heat shock 70 kDa protein 12A-like [Ylistrum balloti]
MMATGGASKILFVAAIDFGTTYSGYAFASKADLDKKLEEGEDVPIQANIWNAGARSLLSSKAPTALLLKPDKSFQSFGYDAENDYSQLVEEEEHEDYYYFHRFKMILHDNPNLRKDTLVKDTTGKSLPAIDVFSHSIKFLKQHLFDTINNHIGGELKEEDIQYVLTVPAIWDDKAKQFMREAARKGGISGDQLMIALEPEAASIHCQNIPLGKGGGEATYMVVDVGGGTADITVHQRSRLGGHSELKELHQATGGAYGGKSVDDAFEKFLCEIIGKGKLKKLREQSMEDYIDIFREFETKKRSFASSTTREKESFSLPVTLTSMVKSDMKLKTMDAAIKQSPYGEQLAFSHHKLQISSELFRNLFQPTIAGILEHMEKIFYDSKFQHVDTIVMVGGFSECKLVQDSIKKRFTLKRIIIPHDPGLAVLKGAVLFGHKPRTIGCRVARYTYGVQSWPAYNDYYRRDKRVVVEGVARCKDVFLVYVEKGQQLTPGHSESQVFRALKADEECLQCAVYISDQKSPTYVDEPGCRLLGILTVPLDQSGPGPAEVEETLVFGETELYVKAKDIKTGNKYQTQFDLLH